MVIKTLLTFAIKPGQSVKWILSHSPYWSILWASFFGMAFLGTQVFIMDAGDQYVYPGFLFAIFYKGAIVGLVFCVLYGSVFFLFAKVFRGTASWLETLTIYGWSAWVYSLRLLFLPLQLLLFGEEMFTSITPRIDGSLFLTLFYVGFLLLDLVVWGWFIVVQVVSLADVHRLAWWQSVLIHLVTVVVVWFVSLQAFGMLIFPL